MPDINFTLAEDKYSSLSKAIEAYNESFPASTVTNENDFAERVTLEALQDYLTRYRNSRLAVIAEHVAVCTDEQWETITTTLDIQE